MANEKNETDKAAAAPKTVPAFPDLKVGESSGNLTRDSIIEFQRGKLMEQGKVEEEAQKLAVKRGFEMIKE